MMTQLTETPPDSVTRQPCYRIGTDEAGYGPTLGPLVVSATLWRETPTEDVGADTNATDDPNRFLETLAEIFATTPPRRRTTCADKIDAAAPRLIATDSKKIYTPATGMALLESQVRGFLTLAEVTEAVIPTRWRTLLTRLAPANAAQLDDVPWYRDADPELFSTKTATDITAVNERSRIQACSGDPISVAANAARQRMDAAGIGLMNIGSRFLDVAAFNAELDRCESKSDLLAETTLGLVAHFLDEISNERTNITTHTNTITTGDAVAPINVAIFCDKFGGRNHYTPLLMRIFHSEWSNATNNKPNTIPPFGWPRAIVEGRAESVYQLENERFRLRIHFTAKGERRVPVAVASMVSKYLRETAMELFNEFWLRMWTEFHANECPHENDPATRIHEPLRPTAGYPEDAVRFLAQIGPLQTNLGIPDAGLRRAK